MAHQQRSGYRPAGMGIGRKWNKRISVGVATVTAVLKNGHKEFIGEVRAYNWEAIWLSTIDFDEIDDPEEWWRCVKDAYERLKKKL